MILQICEQCKAVGLHGETGVIMTTQAESEVTWIAGHSLAQVLELWRLVLSGCHCHTRNRPCRSCGPPQTPMLASKVACRTI